MSYCGSKSDARAAINDIELSPTTGAAGTSPIRVGASGPVEPQVRRYLLDRPCR